jgi:rod shape-determining protein MreD
MQPLFISLFFWTLALVGDTALFSTVSWLQPNLLFLTSVLFCLRWRGSETYFFAVCCGLTADAFSTLPFGVFGLTFFVLSFFTRWYGIRIFQASTPSLIGLAAILTVMENLLTYLVLELVFDQGHITLGWWWDVLTLEVIPTSILAPPGFGLLQSLEKRYRIRLAERKF